MQGGHVTGGKSFLGILIITYLHIHDFYCREYEYRFPIGDLIETSLDPVNNSGHQWLHRTSSAPEFISRMNTVLSMFEGPQR